MENKQEPVGSPCINICVLNEENVCLGCFRNLDEIALWPQAELEVKEQILVNAVRRQIKN